MELKEPYSLQIVVTDNAKCGDVPTNDSIYPDVDQLMQVNPNCTSILFGFRIIDKSTGAVPEGLEPWYNNPCDAYIAYEKMQSASIAVPIATRSTRNGPVARLTKNEESIAAARDELRRAADLLQAVLDHKVYQTDICPELGLTPHSIQYQIAHQFQPYIKTRIETIDGLCRQLEKVRTPGDILLFQVFENAPCYDLPHKQDTILFLPEYDQDVLWDEVYERLSKRELRLIQMLCGTGGFSRMDHKEIAKEFRITTERTHQIHRKALRKLRNPSFIAKVFPAINAGFADCMDAIMANAEPALMAFQEALAQYNDQTALRTAANAYHNGYKPDAAVTACVEQALERQKPAAELKIVKIEDIDLSVRLFNCLRRAQIETLNELADMPLDDIKRIRNLGRKSFPEIGEALHRYLGCNRPELYNVM